MFEVQTDQQATHQNELTIDIRQYAESIEM